MKTFVGPKSFDSFTVSFFSQKLFQMTNDFRNKSKTTKHDGERELQLFSSDGFSFIDILFLNKQKFRFKNVKINGGGGLWF